MWCLIRILVHLVTVMWCIMSFFFISDEKFRTVQVDWIVVSSFSLSLARSIWSPTVGIKQLISLTVIHVSEAITNSIFMVSQFTLIRAHDTKDGGLRLSRNVGNVYRSIYCNIPKDSIDDHPL